MEKGQEEWVMDTRTLRKGKRRGEEMTGEDIPKEPKLIEQIGPPQIRKLVKLEMNLIYSLFFSP